MSDFRAIGGVSTSLQTLLKDRMELPPGTATVEVTVASPRLGDDDKQVAEAPRVNLFLYRVSENGFLQNQEIPGAGSSGAYGHPPLSLNLHYLLTAFGNETVQDANTPLFNETIAQFLLGSAMRVLHDYSILTDSLLTLRTPVGNPIIHPSLLNRYEQIKLTLEPISLEDVTKIWMALSLRYRLSAGYSVSVVQIESQSRRTFPRPVGAPPAAYPPLSPVPPVQGPYIPVSIYANPFINEVRVRRKATGQEQLFPYAQVGDTLILLGSNFNGALVMVEIASVRLPVTPLSASRIEVEMPDPGTVSPPGVPGPGACSLAVLVADPTFLQGAVRSNDSVFMLVPGITAPIKYLSGLPRTITIHGTLLFAPNSTSVTIIGRAPIDKALYVSASPTQLVVPLPDSLPARGVNMLLSSPLSDPWPQPAQPEMSVTIGGTTLNVTLPLSAPSTIPLAQLPQMLTSAIQNGAQSLPTASPAFLGLKVGLFAKRLVLVAGGLTPQIAAADVAPGTLATALGLTAPQPAGATHGYLSGDLSVFPVFAPGTQVGLSVALGAGPTTQIAFAAPATLTDAAPALQTALQAVFPNTMVAVLGTQLLIMPGAGAEISFDKTLTDSLSVILLQLHALYNVRVRVNGADSIDDVTLELPQ